MQEDIRFCPQCGSAAVAYTLLSNSSATCRGCNWTGTGDSLLIVPIRNELGTDTTAGMMNDIRQIVAAGVGTDLLNLLVKWGFIEHAESEKDMTKKLARYLAASAAGILVSIFNTRVELERDMVKERMEANDARN